MKEDGEQARAAGRGCVPASVVLPEASQHRPYINSSTYLSLGHGTVYGPARHYTYCLHCIYILNSGRVATTWETPPHLPHPAAPTMTQPPPLLPPPCRCLLTWSYTGASKKLPVIMILMTHSIKALMSLRHKDSGKCGLHVDRTGVTGGETGRQERGGEGEETGRGRGRDRNRAAECDRRRGRKTE